MEKEILLTNTTGAKYRINYRMPGDTNRIFSVDLGSYEMYKKVKFISEMYYNEFRKQNADYFKGDNPVFIEGKTSKGKLEKVNKAIEKEEKDRIESEIEKTNAVLKHEADKTKAKIKIGVGISKDGDPVVK